MTLHAEYDPDNIFAKILRGEMPCVNVYEDDVALAFMDVFPQAEGHTLVIPKQVTARNFLDMPTEALGTYMERVQRVARAVEAALQPDGVVVTQFNGAPAGQTVFHLHFHIIPRWQDRSLGGHASGQMAEISYLEEIANKIRPFAS
ncbi:MAG: HIT family protein [Henriciella sp.]|nr:HIT family protein [Henriciella sp.]MBO6694659.1 HIT family protein [Henriciella sp.]